MTSPAGPFSGNPPTISLVMGSDTTALGDAAAVRAFFERIAGLTRDAKPEDHFPCLQQELAHGELPAGHVSEALAELDQLARTLPGPTPRTSDGRDLLGVLRTVLKAAEGEGFAVLLV